jgi:Cytochrome c7 and related cytochrome c/Cytochrome c3
MADDEKRKKKKGTFTYLRLAVTKSYVMPVSRRNMVIAGLIGAGIFLVYTGFNSFFQNDSFIARGPLSSKHANFETNCSNCHQRSASLAGLGSVTNQKCSVCHEKFGDKLGVYTYAAHYVYRSHDLTRNVSQPHEAPCFTCHAEHEGRNVDIASVPDARCLVCHKFGSFNDKHPQFEFIRSSLPDPANLKFPHVKHVLEVKKHESLQDDERACLYCHVPQTDGKGFEPISFDRSCSACHLKGDDETPPLKIKSGPGSPGVETLNMIRARKGPGSLWALYTSGNEFQEAGGQVIKHPVYHEDPWIMENLKMLRGEMFADPGISNLLNASADVPGKDVRVLYREAINTLKGYADGLRSRPETEVQDDLRKIDEQLKELERALDDPYTALNRSKFVLGTAEINPRINNLAEFKAVVDSLTSRCRKCHLIENASIVRVQKDQHTLVRAEFNHRAHILQRGCLDCHNRIAIREALDNPSKAISNDRADVQNLPGIETCQQCHRPQEASNRCITCHYFHPNKMQRSNLLLYVH